MKFGFGTICHYQNYDTFQKINTCISYIDMSPKDWKRHILHISGHTSSSFSLRRPICSKWRNTLDAASIYRFQWGGKFGWWLDMLLVIFGMQVCFCFRVSRLNGSCKTATHTSRVNGYSVFLEDPSTYDIFIHARCYALYVYVFARYSCQILSMFM